MEIKVQHEVYKLYKEPGIVKVFTVGRFRWVNFRIQEEINST
jgi:hypothetical protein